MNDKVLILISVFIAMSLWFYVYSGENRETTIRVPVELTDVREGAFAVATPKEIAVLISGPQAIVAQAGLHVLENPLAINTADMHKGMNTLRLSPRDIKIAGVEVLEVSPVRIDVELSSTVKRRVAVSPMILGEPARGYRVANISVEPPHVQVEGLGAEVAAIARVQTRHINIANMRQREYTVTVEFVDYEGIKNIEPNAVNVTVEIVEIIEEQDM